MNNKKRIVNLEYFREMLHICPRIPNQTFDELSFEEEILAFLGNLSHIGEFKKITDFNINKLHQPWRSFAVVINKYLSGKSTGYDSLRNSAAYKEYYAIASGAAPPNTKESVTKTQSSSNTTMPPLTAASTRLLTSAKGKQPTKSSKAKGLSVLFVVALTEAEQMKLATKRSLQQTHISQANGSGVDEELLSTHDEEAKDEESFDPIVQTPSHMENSDDEGNDDTSHGMNVRGDEGPDAEDDDNELYRDVNINLEGIDSLFESTPRVDIPVTTTVESLLLTAPTLPPPSIPIISRTNQFAEAVSSILGIVDRYLDHRMNEAIKVVVQLQFDRLREEAQAKNEDFLNKLDENIQKIIKEQVKVQVSKILPKIKKTVNEQLKVEVLTRASNSSKTSYVVAADLSKLELKKILIEKIKNNKSIHRSDEQRNLYKALVDAYECDKIILDTYRDTVTLKRCHDDEDKDE
uniref:Uncharacterized protein n=1 Tax=Tanacetum cinerariifolium TaxID=118510 RepID=A0A6L2LIW2_TANCI|nr:hypothetical protein [Tanacetum cinerariifolium]